MMTGHTDMSVSVWLNSEWCLESMDPNVAPFISKNHQPYRNHLLSDTFYQITHLK